MQKREEKDSVKFLPLKAELQKKAETDSEPRQQLEAMEQVMKDYGETLRPLANS
ncbi:MAG: hypothetical protein ACRD3N_06655 [Terracidiphilus sp.]